MLKIEYVDKEIAECDVFIAAIEARKLAIV